MCVCVCVISPLAVIELLYVEPINLVSVVLVHYHLYTVIHPWSFISH